MQKLDILVIDDSLEDFELYQRTLKKLFECTIHHSETGTDGINKLKNYNFDLIFLDYFLHDTTGMEVLQLIESDASIKKPPVIMVTGHGNEEVAANSIKLGASDYISKGNISSSSMLRVTKNALEKFQSEQILRQKQQELYYFAHTISHDLRAPLGRIQAYVNLLHKKLATQLPSGDGKYIQNIQQDASYCIEFINSLLQYAEMGRSKIGFKPVQLDEVIQRSLNNLELQIQKSQAKIDVEALPEILGDKIALIQLSQNLISNSIKYCNKQPKIKIYAKPAKYGVSLYFTDNGIGMEESTAQEEIFKPFIRLNNSVSQQGVGLGLALCKTIVGQHGGHIEVSSQVNNGTTFCITFPNKKSQVVSIT